MARTQTRPGSNLALRNSSGAEEKARAAELTLEAQNEIQTINNILRSALDNRSNARRRKFHFDEAMPSQDQLFKARIALRDARSQARCGLLRETSLIHEIEQAYKEEKTRYRAAINSWYRRGEIAQQEFNLSSKRPAKVTANEIVLQCHDILTRSRYLSYFPKIFNVSAELNNKLIVIEYLLPHPDALPRVKEARYVAARSAIVKIEYPAPQQKSLYDNVVCQVCLRTLFEIFCSVAASQCLSANMLIPVNQL